jgi:uncharacterized protein YeaO (DUF488 family)
MIKTKSIQAKREESDDIRICIMRRIKPEFVFDIWMPHLSPSTELLKDYHDEKINWEGYEKLFTKEVLDTQTNYLSILLELSKKYTITLLCWEETPEKCHRRLVVEKLQAMDPTITIKLA